MPTRQERAQLTKLARCELRWALGLSVWQGKHSDERAAPYETELHNMAKIFWIFIGEAIYQGAPLGDPLEGPSQNSSWARLPEQQQALAPLRVPS